MAADRRVSQSGLSAPERFFRYFQHEITALQEQMSRLENKALVSGERKDAADHCLAGITRLASEVKDASSSLPSYDIRTYSEAIKALQDKLAETQAAFAPKQKFAFKTRKNASAISLSDAAELAAQKQRHLPGFVSPNAASTRGSSMATTPIHSMTPPNEQNNAQVAPISSKTESDEAQRSGASQPQPGLARSPTSTTISSRTSTHIIVPTSTQHAQAPCYLSKLQSCCVDLSIPTAESAHFASLMINSVQSSLLLCGLVSGPAHITGVKNSKIVISCRQFRMHECENVDVYLHCTSRPIIEDCEGIRFAKMPGVILDLLRLSDQTSTNLWDQVDDFKWLKAEQSPNWSVLPKDDEISKSTFEDIIPSNPNWDVDKILSAVEITT